jgi:cytochrome bd-type quinol oxidase subunit 2
MVKDQEKITKIQKYTSTHQKSLNIITIIIIIIIIIITSSKQYIHKKLCSKWTAKYRCSASI